MRSVGIMSMQRIRNYGSFLQGYALKRLIEALDRESVVSFVDYRPGETLVKPDVTASSRSGPFRTLSKVVQYSSGDANPIDKLRFLNHKRTYASRYLPLMGVTAEPNYDHDLDVLVIGSDEVFNCVQSNTNVGYARDLFGHGSSARKLISYAGSFGNTTLERIDAFGIRADLEEDFARFASISVRDRNSAEIVEGLTGRSPSLNVDPALAYDFMGSDSNIPPERQFDGKYILVYGYSGRLNHDENVALAAYARSIGAKILCMGGVQGCCDRFVDCNPFELLAYFRHAEAVVTDTFHGTIFSIINQRPFGTIIRPTTGHEYGNEEKLGYLLETFGLSSQRVTDLDRIGDTLGNQVDHSAVRRRLTEERLKTVEYLRGAIVGESQP